MNYKDEILNVRKQKGVSVAKLARITGIPDDRIYKWEAGIGNPKADDSAKLQKWLSGSEEVQVQKMEVEYKPMTIIGNLTESNRILAESVKLMAENNSILVNKISLGAPAAASSVLPEKEKVSTDPVEDLRPGKKGKIYKRTGNVES